MNHILHRMDKLFEWAWLGAATIILEMIIPFITPISGYILFMIMAITADTITGILAAHKKNEKITSRGLWRTIEKIVIAGLAIMLCHGFQILFMEDIPLTKGVSAIIAFAELKSNLENYKKITGVEVGSLILDRVKEIIMSVPSKNKSQGNE